MLTVVLISSYSLAFIADLFWKERRTLWRYAWVSNGCIISIVCCEATIRVWKVSPAEWVVVCVLAIPLMEGETVFVTYQFIVCMFAFWFSSIINSYCNSGGFKPLNSKLKYDI